MGDNTVLKMQGICKAFVGVKALNNVDFSLNKGEVHALLGENGAGKSTLMKILLGIHKQDKGTIEFKGVGISFKSPHEALNNGISMIHQEITLVPEMNVAENIWMGREEMFTGALGLNWKKRSNATKQLFKKLNIDDIDVNAKIKDLTVAKTQLVEIARAVSYDSDIIVMDEPTSSLTEKETEILFDIIHDLSAKGISIVFISHKLEEIFKVCDVVSVFRDGCNVGLYKCSDVTQAELIKVIVGREIKDVYTKHCNVKDEVVLEVKNFSSPNRFKNVNFKLKKGEVLGFCGLVGAGRTEILSGVFGLDKYAQGEIYLHGKRVDINCPLDAIKLGIGMVTEDRLRTGLVYSMSVMRNETLVSLENFCSKQGVLNEAKEVAMFEDISSQLSLKYSNRNELIGNLSGGNQQKIIIARWLMKDVEILIMDEPTRGIDIGSKSEIYKLMDDLTARGVSIIFISSELPEMMAMSDRIIVAREGQLVCECSQADATQEFLMSHAFGIKE